MSDTDIPAEGVPQAQPDAPAEAPAAGSIPEEQGTSPAPEAKPAEEGKPDASPVAEPAKPAESQVPQDSQPKSRRSAQYRIEQLARENAALRQKIGQPEPATEDFGDPQPDETPQQPDIRAAAREEAQRLLEPVLKQHTQAADDSEIAELFSGDRAARRSEYEPKIREAWKLDQYKDLAASDLYKLFSYESDLAKAKQDAIEEWKKAQKEAKESSGSGNSARSHSSPKNAWEMTEEEFKAEQDRVRSMAS